MVKEKINAGSTTANLNLDLYKKNANIGKQFFHDIKHNNFGEAFALFDSELIFNNPIVKDLTLLETINLWKYILYKGRHVSVEYEFISSNDKQVKMHWFLHYESNFTHRKLTNDIVTVFHIKNGKIYAQEDDFDFYEWAKQTYRFGGRLIAKVPFLKRRAIEEFNKHFRNYMNDAK